MHIADSTAETEVQGLIPDAPSLRPADIFTEAAVPGCQAAMDIGITSPDSTGAGDDCCEAMYRTKMARYEQYLPGLTRRGIRYKPMILSAYGRWHPDSLLTMEAITKRAARKRGYMDHRLLLGGHWPASVSSSGEELAQWLGHACQNLLPKRWRSLLGLTQVLTSRVPSSH